MLNYNLDDKVEVSREELEESKNYGLKLIAVCCKNSEEEIELIFKSYVNFVPRINETIFLEDGKKCIVEDVFYKPKKLNHIIQMLPCVCAKHIE